MNSLGDIWRYLQGKRSGREANRLEREALADPFLYEALEGLSAMEADHEQIISRLQLRIQRRLNKKSRNLPYWLVAASFALLCTIVILLNHTTEPSSQEQLAVNHLVMPERMEEDADVPGTEVEIVASERQPGPPENIGSAKQSPEDKGGRDKQPASGADRTSEDNSRHKRIPEARRPFGAKVRAVKQVAADSVKSGNPSVLHQETGSGAVVHHKTALTGTFGAITVQEQADQEKLRKFERYVADSIRYPDEVRLLKTEGEVELSVRLNKRGKPSRIKITRSLSPACNKEAIRLVKDYKGDLGTSERIQLIIPFKY